MRLWIDCEWADFQGDLISMAVVAEDSRAFYAEMHVDPANCNYWVRDNVLPNLDGFSISSAALTLMLGKFLSSLGAPELEVIADWPEDIERFCRALIVGPGKRVSTPRLRFRIVDGDGARSDKPHHALFDARALKEHCLERGL